MVFIATPAVCCGAGELDVDHYRIELSERVAPADMLCMHELTNAELKRVFGLLVPCMYELVYEENHSCV